MAISSKLDRAPTSLTGKERPGELGDRRDVHQFFRAEFETSLGIIRQKTEMPGAHISRPSERGISQLRASWIMDFSPAEPARSKASGHDRLPYFADRNSIVTSRLAGLKSKSAVTKTFSRVGRQFDSEGVHVRNLPFEFD